MKIMFYEVFKEEEDALKRYLPKKLKAGFTFNTIQASERNLPNNNHKPPAPLISIRTQSVIPISWANRLSGILARSTGFGHLQSYLSKVGLNIPCGYLPAYCARSVAEQVFLMIFALNRKLKQQMSQFDLFNRDGLTGRECLGQNLLVVGVGNIGKEIVKVGFAIGMNVKGVDLLKTLPELKYVSLKNGIKNADVIVCALPLNEKTNGMLHYGELCHAKKGTIFINIARGEIAPSRDLKRLLDQGILGGLGLDVYEEETVLGDYLRYGKESLSKSAEGLLKLHNDPRVIFTPHNAFNTRESLDRKAKQSVESILEFLKTGKFYFPIPIEF